MGAGTRRVSALSLSVAVMSLALAGCGSSGADGIGSGDNWPSYAGPGENHYSTLDEIDAGNVERLGLAWYSDIETGPSAQSAPVEVDGVLYFVAGYSVVRALDAKTGKHLWTYDPEVWKVAGKRMRGNWGSRGLAWDKGKIFVGTADGRLIAIDAKTGNEAWSVQTLEEGDSRYITGAPWVFDGKVAIGHGGADFAPVRGYVTAYDQASGRQAWRFYTVPGDPAKGFENEAMAKAAKTWTGEWWKFGGGGTVWNAMAYDPALKRLYIGTGNGAPWNRKIRSPGGGDNLYLCSIIALDAETGKYLWHYQVNPGETWDYNAAMDITLADLEIGGETKPVILHAPKNGFFYVIDRRDGKLISAKNFVPVNWASRIDIKTGRPVENPAARYPDGGLARVMPSGSGAHSTEAMSYNPRLGLAYIPALENEGAYIDPTDVKGWAFTPHVELNTGTGSPPAGTKLKPPSSVLMAWDPLTQKERWRRVLPGARSFGGTAATAGDLVFAGNSEGRFEAYAGDSGRVLWSFDAGSAVLAQPITYRVGGQQYVSVIAGSRLYNAAGQSKVWNYRTQRWRMLTFALDGKAKLPAPIAMDMPIQDDPAFKVDASAAARGGALFSGHCLICHGAGAIANGAAPSLLESAIPLDPEAFRTVVVDGALQVNGMPRFEELTPAQLSDLRHYIRQRARDQAGK